MVRDPNQLKKDIKLVCQIGERFERQALLVEELKKAKEAKENP